MTSPIANCQLPIATPSTMTLAQAAAALPGTPHPATIKRWIRDGLKATTSRRRVYLGGQRIGGRWYVTPAAIDEFIKAISEPPEQPKPRRRSRRSATRHHEQVMEELRAMGAA